MGREGWKDLAVLELARLANPERPFGKLRDAELEVVYGLASVVSRLGADGRRGNSFPAKGEGGRGGSQPSVFVFFGGCGTRRRKPSCETNCAPSGIYSLLDATNTVISGRLAQDNRCNGRGDREPRKLWRHR